MYIEGYYKNVSVKSSNDLLKKVHPLMKEPEPPQDLNKIFHYFIPTDFYLKVENDENKIEKLLESSFLKKNWMNG